jgi:hypothetical protein
VESVDGPVGPRHGGELVARWAGPAAVALTVVAALMAAGSLVHWGWAAGRVPLGNMYELVHEPVEAEATAPM